MATKSAKADLNLKVAERDGMKGIVIDGFLPFAAFSEAKAGATYLQPMPATGENGEQLYSEDGKTRLYVLVDGTFAPMDWDLDEDEWTQTYRSVEKTATSHRDLRKKISEASIVWPNGQVGDIAFQIKANNFQSPEQFAATKAERSQKAIAASAKTASNEELRRRLDALKAELNSRGIPAEGAVAELSK